MSYIDLNKSLYHLVTQYPEVKEYLMGQGLDQVENQELLETIGKNITVGVLIQSKKINKELFVSQLEAIIFESRKLADTTLLEKERNHKASIKIQGILPCPVRIPLLEAFEAWMEKQDKDYQGIIDYELKAASMGVEWLKEAMEKSSESRDVASEVADVFLSAGFDLFFDNRYMGHLKKEKVFQDMMQMEGYNMDFDNDTIDLKDPDKDYSIIGTVPAVFLINHTALGDKPVPFTWEALIGGEYENQVSLPVGDFDLFNAILLNIHKQFGLDGVRRLGKTLMKSMHPSEMVKSGTKPNQPAVTIMPFFFTKMTRPGSNMEAVWPKDGAIISPIFMLSKREKRDQVQPIVDFFSSKEVGEILSHNGRFPSTHPQVDNLIPKENRYMWIGWDYIKDNDIGLLIEECMKTFEGGDI